MISKLFFRESWVKAMAVVVLWTLSMAYLIHAFGPSFSMSLLDSTVHTLLVLGGFFLLENVFRFYVPRRANLWLAFILPLLLSVVVVFMGSSLLQYLIIDSEVYLNLLKDSFLVRGLILLILFASFGILLLMDSRLEDQLKSREREEMIQQMSKDAELYLLRQQLQPHFLFNSLNSISALIKNNPDQAREMVIQLSEFLRGTIRKDDKKWVTVEEELAYLNLFLDIERVRFGKRLQVVFDLDDNIATLKMPQLMIQPLLENALKHGLYGNIGDVSIVVDIKKTASLLVIEISNPFDPLTGKPEGLGFGLQAVKRRLYLLFGRNDLLSCVEKENTFTVNLKIPQLYDSDSDH